MILRPPTRSDLPAIGDIYNHYVRTSTCTFATEPMSAGDLDEWFAEHQGAHPAIVAEDGAAILGWGSLSRWNNRCAYRFSVEDSVYVHPERHRRGIGAAVLGSLIDLARTLGHRSIVAQIADHQPASEALHERFGFRRVGVLENIGFKFDRWIDVAIWQLSIGQALP